MLFGDFFVYLSKASHNSGSLIQVYSGTYLNRATQGMGLLEYLESTFPPNSPR
jgi:hypothetical protein